jgi:hypothetical protein
MNKRSSIKHKQSYKINNKKPKVVSKDAATTQIDKDDKISITDAPIDFKKLLGCG